MHARTNEKQALIDYTVLGSILLDSAHLYLKGKSVKGTWDGLVHGKTGKLRAQRLIEYLKYCGIEEQSSDKGPSKPKINEKGLLALLLAIFGEESSFFLGRSSRLVALIAHQMIVIIGDDAIDSDACVVPLEYSIFYYFDPIGGVRSWLREVLKDLSSIEGSELKASAKILEEKLINQSLEIKPCDLVGHPNWVSKATKAVCAENGAGFSPTLAFLYGYQPKLLSNENKKPLKDSLDCSKLRDFQRGP